MAGNILKGRKIWVIILVAFLVLVIFVDRNNYLDRRELKKEIKTLHTQREYYLDRIKEDSTVLEKLKDDGYLEQYAREHYLMKKDEEIVYIMERN